MSSSKQKTAFISYRIRDNKESNLAFHLFNELSKNNVKVFLDSEKLRNDKPILSQCVHQAGECYNYILLLNMRLLDELIEAHSHNRNGQSSIDYVYEELSAAIRKKNVIIPVFFEKCDEADIIQRERDLFVGCFGLQDSYRHVEREPGESDLMFFRRIEKMIDYRGPSYHVDLSQVYWVGTRQSDMPVTGDGKGFKGGVFLFGDTPATNFRIMCDSSLMRRVDHNDSEDKEQDEFIRQSIQEILATEPDARFMFYNPTTVYRLDLAEVFGSEHFLCLNSKEILDCVNNKRKFRDLIKDVVPLLPVIERTRTDCDYDDLLQAKECGEFDDSNDYSEYYKNCDSGFSCIEYDENLKFIVQAPVASGGSGTFILTKENAKYILSALNKTATYLVSVYYTNNVPVNMHAIIFDNDIVYTPASIQIEREVDAENKLMYKGADFIAYNQIPLHLRSQFQKQVQKVARRLQERGYRGVCGVDGIIHDGRVNILEVNGRFQASTELINRALLSLGEFTLQELNYLAFHSPKDDISIHTGLYQSLRVYYSNYTYSYEGSSQHDVWIHGQAEKLVNGYSQADEPIVVTIQDDGYRVVKNPRFCAQAYLYRLAFNRNIVSVSEDCSVYLNENLTGSDKWLRSQILSRNKLALKLALLMLGINVETEIRQTLRAATNNAVDLQLGEDNDMMIINSPTNIRYVEFSPFTLIRSERIQDKYSILYYGELLIDCVGVFPADQNQSLTLKNHSYSEIAYLSTDRLRVHLTNKCCFKSSDANKDKGCWFCNIAINDNPCKIRKKDISEVVAKYIDDKKCIESDTTNKSITLQHFLIGGQSLTNGDQMLIEAAEAISEQNQFYQMPIYVMTLPLSEDEVKRLVKLGVYEFAYNIEIFNKRCRAKYMPGKSKRSVDEYISALAMTRRILNGVHVNKSKKVVRSMVIVGLEPYSDMMNGIRRLIENDIEPMLSVFRPLPGTKLSDKNAPPIRMVYDLFYKVSCMLYEKNPKEFRKLGPKCTCCQNNTVSLPWFLYTTENHPTWKLDPNNSCFKENIL